MFPMQKTTIYYSDVIVITAETKQKTKVLMRFETLCSMHISLQISHFRPIEI